jgi:hypothetical protein
MVLCGVCLLGASQSAFAAERETAPEPIIVTPYWITLRDITLGLSYSGGTVSWDGMIFCTADVTSISASYKPEKKNSNGTYSSVNTWSYKKGAFICLSSA